MPTDESGPADERLPEFDRWRTELRARFAATDEVRIDVYLRSLLPPPGAKDSQVDVLRSLQEVADEMPMIDISVDIWGERLCLCEHCRALSRGSDALQTIREFESWGDRFDASAAPFFEQTRHSSQVTGHSYEGVVPPRVTAAVTVDGSLCGVFPSRFGDRTYSVHDFAETLLALNRDQLPADQLEPSQQ